MRTIKQLPVPQEQDPKFPFGTIQNENEDGTVLGTPVVREIYGDILTNFYAVLRDSGIVPNGTEDNDDNGYQFLQALRKFTNDQNDIEQVLTLTGSDFSINLDIDNLPNKYVIFARTASGFTSGVSYTFSGTGNNSFSLTSPTGFKSSDEVMIVIDTSGVRVYSLNTVTGTSSGGTFPVFGAPVAYNDSDTLYYDSDGQLFTDIPSVYNLQNQIRLAASNSTLYVNEVFVLNGKVLCFVFDTDVQTYSFYQFDLANLNTASAVTLTGVSIPTGTDNAPYAFTDGEFIYLTNSSGNSANNYELDKLTYNHAAGTLAFAQDVTLDASYVKTTNTVFKGTNLFTFVNGTLTRYSLNTGSPTNLGTFPAILGQIFNLKNEVYYTNGEVAKKWDL